MFSKRDVVRRINAEFIPVALKAGHVNNPPRGLEGDLYREIGRSKPAPQGICVANSAGKVLDWALMFDNDESVLGFLDHCLKRYAKFPDATQRVPAERYMKFPSQKLADVADTTGKLEIAQRHSDGSRCLGKPALTKGTLVGRIIGRALDKAGKPVADTLRQEHYMEARIEVPVDIQTSFAEAFVRAGAARFPISDDLARALVTHAYLGQLDVNPLGVQPGGKNDSRDWRFWAQRVGANENDQARVHIQGTSHVVGGQSSVGRKTDGRRWEHSVKLDWEGYIDLDLKQRRFKRLTMVARGDEKLRWGNRFRRLNGGPDVSRLPAGHPIDLTCGVRYGLVAEPCSADEVAEVASVESNRPGQPRPGSRNLGSTDQLIGMLGPRFVLLRERVWAELRLSAQQKQQLVKLRQSESALFADLLRTLPDEKPERRPQRIMKHRRDATKRVVVKRNDLLNKNQQQRLAQIELQQQGLFALGDPDIQSKVELTNDQRREFFGIMRALQRRIQSLQRKAESGGNSREVQQQIMELRRKSSKEIAALLTQTQQQKWKELLGKPL